MFHWFFNLFSRGSEVDVYRPRERAVYKYWNGQGILTADPLVLYKKIMAVGPELDIDMKIARSPLKEARSAHDNMLKKLRDVFGVKSMTDGGLTEGETIGLFDHFMDFCGEVKKNLNHSQTSPVATPVPSGPSSVAGHPTSNSSDSGSTASEPSTARPVPSPTVPELPSVP